MSRDPYRTTLQRYVLEYYGYASTHYGSTYHGVLLPVERRGHLVRVGGRVGVRAGARVRVRVKVGARVRVGVGLSLGLRVRGLGSGG